MYHKYKNNTIPHPAMQIVDINLYVLHLTKMVKNLIMDHFSEIKSVEFLTLKRN